VIFVGKCPINLRVRLRTLAFFYRLDDDVSGRLCTINVDLRVIVINMIITKQGVVCFSLKRVPKIKKTNEVNS